MIENKSIIYAFQILGLAIMLFVLLIPRTLQVGGTWSQTLHSTYLSMGKVGFVLGLYVMILPSLLDIPNFTFFIMDTKVFNALSKISFWTYLIHYMVVLQVTYSQKLDFYYTVEDILPLYIPIAAISVILGFLGTIFI